MRGQTLKEPLSKDDLCLVIALCQAKCALLLPPNDPDVVKARSMYTKELFDIAERWLCERWKGWRGDGFSFLSYHLNEYRYYQERLLKVSP